MVVAEGKVVTVKLAPLVPAAMVTLGGMLAVPGRLLDRVTTVPPAGAGLGSVTVPVAELPPVTLFGLTLNEERVAGGGGVPAGFTVKMADLITPPPVTEIVTTVWTETKVVITWIAPLVVLAGIMTLFCRNGSTVGLSLVT